MEIVEKLYLKWCEFGGCKKFVTLAVTSVWRFLPMHGLSSSTRFFAWMFFYTFVTFFPHLFRDFVNTFATDLSNCFTILSHFFSQFLSFLRPFAKGCRKPAKHIQKKVKVSSFYTLQLYCQFTLFLHFFYNCFSNLHFLHTFFCTCFSHSPFCYTFYTCPTHTFFTVVFPTHTFFALFFYTFFTVVFPIHTFFTLFFYMFFTLFSYLFYSCISNLHFSYTFCTLFLYENCKKSVKKVKIGEKV